ncbi:hypothetical protein BLNAU_19148 [Blattamonas nauphoetae]|uniref:Uncharacterized protein n=1 Tax=Blattamonas nauphoetae TaxID=2049346 RepID=A0ABQ9X2D1_9EUKA|nr:hypothetical protein BLNAU_19148 [Blattamonas nauphoetae]
MTQPPPQDPVYVVTVPKEQPVTDDFSLELEQLAEQHVANLKDMHVVMESKLDDLENEALHEARDHERILFTSFSRHVHAIEKEYEAEKQKHPVFDVSHWVGKCKEMEKELSVLRVDLAKLQTIHDGMAAELESRKSEMRALEAEHNVVVAAVIEARKRKISYQNSITELKNEPVVVERARRTKKPTDTVAKKGEDEKTLRRRLLSQISATEKLIQVHKTKISNLEREKKRRKEEVTPLAVSFRECVDEIIQQAEEDRQYSHPTLPSSADTLSTTMVSATNRQPTTTPNLTIEQRSAILSLFLNRNRKVIAEILNEVEGQPPDQGTIQATLSPS